MDPLVTRLAGSTGTALARSALRKVNDSLLGTRRERALAAAHQKAIIRAVDEIAANASIDEIELSHAVGLLARLAQDAEAGDWPIVASGQVTDPTLLSRWRERAERLGLDPATFPLPFDRLVEKMITILPEEIQAAAVEEDGVPLLPSVALTQLETLRSGITILARLVPLDGPLRDALDIALLRCQAANRRTHTPDVLLALLSSSDSSVADCFDVTRPGLAARVREALTRYITTTETTAFQPFDWLERAEIQRAQELVWRHDVPAVSGCAVLVGILSTPSNTRTQLARLLGEEVPVLLAAAWARMISPAVLGTPGEIFGSDEPENRS